MRIVNTLLKKKHFNKQDIIDMLSLQDEEKTLLFEKAMETKQQYVGKATYLRGLVEFSNICGKNCLYCGIRRDNKNIDRYNLTDLEILEAASYAYKNRLGSLVLQSGELSTPQFIDRIDHLLKQIKQLSDNALGITLSVGEQSEETYSRWYESGAHRFLLRIETSNKKLFEKIHPQDNNHIFEKRLAALQTLQKTGYQTGTGVMIGLPSQTVEDLADDLIFMRDFDIDMVGMGPYLVHQDTPMQQFADELLPIEERFGLTLKMIAVLRILMKDINIAAATALQAADPLGREKAIKIGANVIMPNITPGCYRDSYKLYENKPCTDEKAEDCLSCLEARIQISGDRIGYEEWGDSIHYFKRIATKKSNH